jgi:serine/threonine protein phosphatase PrpC
VGIEMEMLSFVIQLAGCYVCMLATGRYDSWLLGLFFIIIPPGGQAKDEGQTLCHFSFYTFQDPRRLDLSNSDLRFFVDVIDVLVRALICLEGDMGTPMPRFHLSQNNGRFYLVPVLLFVGTYWIVNVGFVMELDNTLRSPPPNERPSYKWDIPFQVLPSIIEMMNGTGTSRTSNEMYDGGRESSSTLVGYYTFVDSKACQDVQDAFAKHASIHDFEQPSLSASASALSLQRCIMHYPFLDIQDYKEDEAAHHSPFEAPHHMSLLERIQQQQQRQQQGTTSSLEQDEGIQIASPLQQQQWMPNASNSRALLDPNSAILTRRGYRGGSINHQINQDRLFLLFPYIFTMSGLEEEEEEEEKQFFEEGQGPSSTTLLERQKYNFVMGIFDGHGDWGHKVSHWAVIHFPKILSQALEQMQISIQEQSGSQSQQQQVKKALFDTFLQVDASIPTPIGRMGGCTASIILRLDTTLYIANVGDSQSFIAAHVKSTQSTHIVHVTRRDKPLLEGEKSRIEALGGKITGQGPLSSRVVIRRPGLGAFTLAMSRSMGDFDGRDIGVIAEPIVNALDIPDLLEKNGLENRPENDVELFAVTASDGIYDFIPKEEVAEYLSKSLYHELDTDISTAVENLIMESSHRWIKRRVDERDDISIAVQRIIINSS